MFSGFIPQAGNINTFQRCRHSSGYKRNFNFTKYVTTVSTLKNMILKLWIRRNFQKKIAPTFIRQQERKTTCGTSTGCKVSQTSILNKSSYKGNYYQHWAQKVYFCRNCFCNQISGEQRCIANVTCFALGTHWTVITRAKGLTEDGKYPAGGGGRGCALSHAELLRPPVNFYHPKTLWTVFQFLWSYRKWFFETSWFALIIRNLLHKT